MRLTGCTASLPGPPAAGGGGGTGDLAAPRRAGPPNAPGFYTGVAAGALGSLAYGLSCPFDAIGHLGIWHVAPVAVSAALGRLGVPVLIRW